MTIRVKREDGDGTEGIKKGMTEESLKVYMSKKESKKMLSKINCK